MESLRAQLGPMRVYLSKLRPWAVIATVVALVLVNFYAYQGWQYWLAWDELRALSLEKERILTKLGISTPEVEQMADELSVEQLRLVQFDQMFGQADSNKLIGMLSSISWETGVELPTISAGVPKSEDIGSNRYRTQPMNIAVQGDIEDIYSFILAVQEKLPFVALSSISIASPGEAASSQIGLVFYLSPQPIAGAEEAD